jgi:hypothetical protein
MKYFFLFIILFVSEGAFAQQAQDSIMDAMTEAIHKTADYDKKKMAVIQQMERTLGKTSSAFAEKRFDLTEKIYEEYKIFNYDSAYRYSRSLLEIAQQMGDQQHVASAKMKMIFILLSAGLYKETSDSLSTLDVSSSPDSMKAEYFTLRARYYFDIAAYENDNYHSVDYDIKGSAFLDSALAYYKDNSFEKDYYSGLRYFKKGNLDTAFSFFTELMNRPGLTEHEIALTASTISGIYQQKGNTDKSIELLAQAAIADVKSSTKETFAIFRLAELLYKKGELKLAAMCIESAVANAEFYGARQRKIQASTILPLIDAERIAGIEAQRHLLMQYSIVLSVLVLALIFLAYIIYRQVQKLKKAQKLLTEANQQQHKLNAILEETNADMEATNKQLEETNKRFERTNDKLQEANKIKEEYIAYFFNTDSQFYARLENIKNTLLQKISDRKYDEVRFFVDKIDPKREKEELLQNFDKLFLKLFPHFIDEINALLHPEEAIVLKDNELLNTDLRIFALIRMGISDTEKIAQILDYSVKTIYAYKTKMKNKSIVPNDEFEKKIMKIKTL